MSRHEEAKLSRVGQTLFGFHPPSYSLLRLSAVTMQLMGGIDPLYNGSGRPFMKTEESGLQCGFTQDDICKGLDSLVFIEYSIHTQDGAVTTATGGWLCEGTSSTD